ncbi:hypothetical protein GCM10027258_90330 [Amycolatopsis stemonae]
MPLSTRDAVASETFALRATSSSVTCGRAFMAGSSKIGLECLGVLGRCNLLGGGWARRSRWPGDLTRSSERAGKIGGAECVANKENVQVVGTPLPIDRERNPHAVR